MMINLEEAIKILESNSMRRPPDVSCEPLVELGRWKVYELKVKDLTERTRHFVGYNYMNREGRVSSPIISFDKEKRIGVTRSGREYRLQDEHGFDKDAQYVFGLWCKRNEVTDIVDVSNEYVV